MAEAPSFGTIPTKHLKTVFKKYVDKSMASTSKSTGNDVKPLAGTCTSVGTLLEQCVGKKYKEANDSIVFKKYTDKTKGSQTFGKLKADTFCMKEFWLELEAVKIAAEKKVKKPPLDDPKVVEGAKQTMTKVASFHSVDLTAPKKTTTGGKAGAVTDRLTDTKRYTGSHKERFDETGKGRGAAGRKDIPSGSGYVGNYKGAGTYGRGSEKSESSKGSTVGGRPTGSKTETGNSTTGKGSGTVGKTDTTKSTGSVGANRKSGSHDTK